MQKEMYSLSRFSTFSSFAPNTKQRTQRSLKLGSSRQIRAMRAIVQRVSSASVEVDGRIVSEIGPGLLVLVGVHESDSDSDADYICRKVLNMRLFPNENTGKGWDLNVMQKNYGVLLVSQFTLYGVLKGNKPDFHVAMPPQKAKPFYESLVDKFRKAYNSEAIKGGTIWYTDGVKVFYTDGASNTYSSRNAIERKFNELFFHLGEINLVNDGPVTMQLDSSQPSK